MPSIIAAAIFSAQLRVSWCREARELKGKDVMIWQYD
jgi:hypothetical protein